MGCHQHRQDLSLELDGRLPAGRHAALQAHLHECAGCAEFSRELQAAQALTFDLPHAQVGRGFRDRLWARIEAGEAAPAVDVLPPVPAAAKLRYVLLGAAAAAAMIAVVRLGFPGSQAPLDPGPQTAEQPRETPIATGPNVPLVANTPTAPSASVALPGQPQPLHPYYLARYAANSAAQGASVLKQLQVDAEKEPIEWIQPRVDVLATDLRGPVRLMTWLTQKRFIEPQQQFSRQIAQLETTLSLLAKANAPGELRFALSSARELEPESLRSHFFVRCCEEDRDFAQEFARFNEQHPDEVRTLRIEVRMFSVTGDSATFWVGGAQPQLQFVPQPQRWMTLPADGAIMHVRRAPPPPRAAPEPRIRVRPTEPSPAQQPPPQPKQGR